jgi:hypothetical protein
MELRCGALSAAVGEYSRIRPNDWSGVEGAIAAAAEVAASIFAKWSHEALAFAEAGMRADANYGPSLFRVRNARAEEALGTKIFETREFPASASKQ